MERYSRQVLYKGIGESGQHLISTSTVLIVGVGALGSLSAEMLARAGVRKLILIDRDYVEYSNLQRQTLYTAHDAQEKTPKVIAAKGRLMEIRPDLEVEAHIAHCDAQLLMEVAASANLLLDGTDNFDTRLMINDVAYKIGIPWVYAACVEASYSSAGFIPGSTPCYRCLVPILPSTTLTCDTAGIIGPAVQMAVAEQVTTGLKILTEQFAPPYYMRVGNIWDMDHMKFRMDAMHSDECETCGIRPVYPSLLAQADHAMRLCGRDTVQVMDPRINGAVVDHALGRLGTEVNHTPYFKEFHYENFRFVCFNNGRLLIHGLGDMNKARTLVNQLFG
ncbi:ThiF family adenylyltransferase [Salinicoccus sesuvii]|uniref:ThiF family adenylyltransferase n=1 Tax=Salinicoccus sesuvii TaxID=868281 RepID=A0ABV7N8M2_9STAP